MKKMLIAALLSTLTGGATADGFFEDPVAYAGLGIAKHSFEDDGLFSGTDRDDEDNGAHFFGGYRFNRYLAVEVSARDLGEYEATGPGFIYRNDFTAVTVGAVGTLPLNDYFAVYGRVGAGAISMDERLNGSAGHFSDDDAGGTSTLGAGVEFRTPVGNGNGLMMRLGWESHFFTIETERVVYVNGLNYYYYDEDEYDQRIDSFGVDVAYYFSW